MTLPEAFTGRTDDTATKLGHLDSVDPIPVLAFDAYDLAPIRVVPAPAG